MTARATCMSVTCCSNERTLRILVAISEPIEMITTATSASATSTSMIVKPATLFSLEGRIAGDNVYPPRQPVDANLVARIQACQRDRAAARGAVGKEADRRQPGLPPAGLRQHRIEANVFRNADLSRRYPRADCPPAGIHQGRDADIAVDCGVPVR